MVIKIMRIYSFGLFIGYLQFHVQYTYEHFKARAKLLPEDSGEDKNNKKKKEVCPKDF